MGNRVELVAWPKNSVLAKMAVGEHVPMLVVASGQTDAAGQFKLTYAPTQKLADFAASEGLANFMLQSAAGGLLYSIQLSQPVDPGGQVRAAANSSDSMGSKGTDNINLRPTTGYKVNAPLAKKIQVKSSTKFVYLKFRYACAGSGYSGPTHVRATSYAGGASYQTIPRPAAKYCVSQSKGSSFTKQSTRSSTIAGAVGTSGDIGFNLNAQTGWSSSANIKFSFSAKRNLCGTSGYPAASPGELRAKEL